MTDAIESALEHIQERCRTSWSENEIIRLIEDVKTLRQVEKKELAKVYAAMDKPMVIRTGERWG